MDVMDGTIRGVENLKTSLIWEKEPQRTAHPQHTHTHTQILAPFNSNKKKCSQISTDPEFRI